MLAMEMIDPARHADRSGRPACAPETAARLQRCCLERGLILELGGRHGSVVRLLPPLIITEREVDELAQILSTALACVSKA
jgi:diaminobutyrate-2-oxoglutarate transaminase